MWCANCEQSARQRAGRMEPFGKIASVDELAGVLFMAVPDKLA